MMYQDTDSSIICHSSPFLADCCREEREADEGRGTVKCPKIECVMEDESSPEEQSGLYKLEGLYTRADVKTNKCYKLEGEVDVLRMRATARVAHSALRTEHWGQDPEKNVISVRRVALRPTAGLEMCLTEESRCLTNSFNRKRKFSVSYFSLSPLGL